MPGMVDGPEEMMRGLARVEERLKDLPHDGAIGWGIETNGQSIDIEQYEDDSEAVDIGTFDDGWITQPAISGECDHCDGEQPAIVHGHPPRSVIIIDCLGCQTRSMPLGGDD